MVFGLSWLILIISFAVGAEIGFDHHPIDSGMDAWYAVPADLDGDGDVDVVGNGRMDGRILWWENEGERGFTRHLIAERTWPMGTEAVDLDADGDIDVVVAVQGDHHIFWYENRGSHFLLGLGRLRP